MAMLIKNAQINGQCLDVGIEHGRIAAISHSLTGLADIDAKGCALLPGLHDHHIHLNACAAAMGSVRCGPPQVMSAKDLIKALNMTGKGWLRGVGYHHSVAGKIDRAWLDTNGPHRPVRIQHRGGRLWILNSLAMTELGIVEPKNGRLIDSDVKLRAQSQFPDLKPLIARLLSYGITGVTEVTPSNGLREYENYIKNAQPLKLSIMGHAELSAGQSQHLKLHYHDHDLPALGSLADEIVQAYRLGRNIAAHCVTRAELMLMLAAIDVARERFGPVTGDRIEHAAIADEVMIGWMKRLDLIVVTQPNFIAERIAAYKMDVPKHEHENLWRLKSFAQAGLKLAAGSDAPFGDANPWAAMAAAMSRPKGFETEAISAQAALALYLKPSADAGAKPRQISVGMTADLCLLDRNWQAAQVNLAQVNVAATWIDGKLAHQSNL